MEGKKMHINETSIEDEVLPSDLKQATKLMLWRNYCIAEMNKCLNMQDNRGTHHWTFDYQMAVNDLKNLQFKKTDHERKMKK